MAIAVVMPKQGQSVETCIITKWFKKKGEHVSPGDILFSYETDKAAFDLESNAEGILLDIFFGEGDEVPVLVNVAVVGLPGEEIDSFYPEQASLPASNAIVAVKAVEAEMAVETVKAEELNKVSLAPGKKTRISPRAKRMAKEKGLSYSNIEGSGPNGRIIAGDIEKALSGPAIINESFQPGGSEYTEKPLSNVRKIIGKAMYNSLQSSAQLTHHMSADVRKLLETRQKIKNNISSGKIQQNITLNDMLCWCVIRALEKFPEANSHYLNDHIRTFHKIHLGIAVDTPRGLLVPTVINAGDMELAILSRELQSVADACKKGSISPELIRSNAATFTVSNLGSYGVEMFTPVINLPQVGILGVCTIIMRPSDTGNGILGFVPFIGLSLTYDHRAIDGGPATLFLREIKQQIEAFIY